jgi:hypothetical protein
MTLSSRLVEYISAAFTGIWIQSHEHLDALGEIVQALAQQVVTGKQNRCFVLILSPVVGLPTELEKLFCVLEHDLPGREQLEAIARGSAYVEMDDWTGISYNDCRTCKSH